MRQANLMALADPAWIDVLRAEAAKDGRSKQAIADELGISRTAVSLLCAGKYTARMDKVSAKIAPKVMALYSQQVWCPHLRAPIGQSVCTEHHSAPMTMSDPDRLKQWAACRGCSQNPENQKTGECDAV
ncbi:DNA-binding XRE family transcriptional regulator [Rhizobium aquaticum]|uniref:DNA-binding XRE family transcriptional regulator n=1 Tax=Rhizobium aquaticum TaxID=1549636 RepID=A0ABV2ITF3_9HYPH